MNRRPWFGSAVVLGLLVGLACGGGGGGGPTGPPPPPPGINFTPESAASAESLHLQQGPETGAERLFLQVRVNQVDDFYGVAFDLEFPSNLLRWIGVEEGSFLGNNTSLEVAEAGPGLLVVGHTRLGSQPGQDGSGILMTLEFAAVGNGSGEFSFENEQAFRTNSFPQTVDFIAGTVSVQP